jgi:hypothetical protein
MKRRLKTFDHLRDAKEFHAIVHRRRTQIAAVLDEIKDDLRNGNKTITLTRNQAEMIVNIFRLFRR